MALSGSGVWEVRTAGSDTNGGGFKRGAAGTDYSQQDAKNTAGNNISTADAVANGTTTITSATASFTAAIVGNFVYFTGGTGAIAAQWREVTVFTNATTITIDVLIAASTGMTLNIGGALATPGRAGGNKIANQDVYIKAGTYSITSASANVVNGCVSDTTGGSATSDCSRWEGYQTTRGDKGTPPVLQASGISGATLFAASVTMTVVDNITVDGATLGTMSGLTMSGTTSWFATKPPKRLLIECSSLLAQIAPYGDSM